MNEWLNRVGDFAEASYEFLPGGIAHQETFDPKPLAPVEYRGEFGTAPPRIEGEVFSEVLP